MEKTKQEAPKQTETSLKLKQQYQHNVSSGLSSMGGNSELLRKIEAYMAQNEILLAKVYKTSEKVRKYLFWINMMNVLKTLLIILPLVLSIIYLPYFLKSLFPNMGSTTGGDGSSVIKTINPKEILNQYKELFGK